MRAPSRASLAPWLLEVGIERLPAVYLMELELVAHGLPEGPLTLAPVLWRRCNRQPLFDAAFGQQHSEAQQLLAARLGEEGILGDRERMLAMADSARHSHLWRRAVQLYGWLMLTATRGDAAFEWGTFRLLQLRRSVYLRQPD